VKCIIERGIEGTVRLRFGRGWIWEDRPRGTIRLVQFSHQFIGFGNKLKNFESFSVGMKPKSRKTEVLIGRTRGRGNMKNLTQQRIANIIKRRRVMIRSA
jgi:hypothetical protein